MSDPFETARSHHQQGRLTEAEQGYRNVIVEYPDHARAIHLLGLVAYQRQDFGQSIELIQKAIKLAPQTAKFQHSLSLAMMAVGNPAGAEAACREAVQLQPKFLDAQTGLGQALAAQRQFAAAEVELRGALALNNSYAVALNALGNVLREQGKRTEAIQVFQQAVQAAPNLPHAHTNLGQMLVGVDANQAYLHCARAVELQANAVTLCNLGNALRDLGRLDEAAVEYAKALEINASLSVVHLNLAILSLEQGEVEQSYERFRKSLACDPNSVEAYSGLVANHADKLTVEDKEAVKQLLQSQHINDRQRADLHFARAKICDRAEQFETAATQSTLANDWQLKWNEGGIYDRQQHTDRVTKIIEVFDAACIDRLKGWGNPSQVPIFIVGVPRSGTTVTEQLLASHPQIYGAGELRQMRNTVNLLPSIFGSTDAALDCLPRIDKSIVEKISESCLQMLKQVSGDSARVIDKMPSNYLHIGWILSLFPKARIIHCRRDERDTALSCWMNNFLAIRWANRPEDIITQIADYHRMMAHWESIASDSIMSVDYHETVSEPEAVAKRLLDWLELPWDDACSAAHESQRVVRTNMAQVRQPVHQRSVGKWKNYEAYLPNLFEGLMSA